MPKVRGQPRMSSTPSPAAGVPRQRPVSCALCRSRKLRCSRTVPCTNCSSRGATCQFDVPGLPTPASPAPLDQTAVLVEILERLRRIEETISKNKVSENDHLVDVEGTATITPRSLSEADDVPASPLPPVGEDLAVLEQVSMGREHHPFRDQIYATPTVFHAVSIESVLTKPTYLVPCDTASLAFPGNEVIKVIYLPQYNECKTLFDKYVSSYSYLQHIVHHPTLPTVVDRVYERLERQESNEPGDLILLLSIIATATYTWSQDDFGGYGLFANISDAHAQAPFWVKATLEILESAHRSAYLSLELLQGLIVITFIVGNMEGISLRYRSLISTAIVMGREMGLHQTDLPGKEKTGLTPLRRELGRRIWWYLAATDWHMAARYTGPTEGAYQIHPNHMVVNKPLNLNDTDFLTDSPLVERPLSEPTEMTYFLQRIRLSEIARRIIDTQPMRTSSSPNYQSVMAIDAELANFLETLPPFFKIETEDQNEQNAKFALGADIRLQVLNLNSLVQTQRCKLHLPYLNPQTSKPYSRSTCLDSARRIVQIETRLDAEKHPFVYSRLRCSGTLYGLFMASTVLLMELCSSRRIGGKNDRGDADLNRRAFRTAFRILGNARRSSVAAGKVWESLVRVMGEKGIRLGSLDDVQGDGDTAVSFTTSNPNTGKISGSALGFENSGQDLGVIQMYDGVGDGTAQYMTGQEGLSVESLHFEELMQSLGQSSEVENAEWNSSSLDWVLFF